MLYKEKIWVFNENKNTYFFKFNAYLFWIVFKEWNTWNFQMANLSYRSHEGLLDTLKMCNSSDISTAVGRGSW